MQRQYDGLRREIMRTKAAVMVERVERAADRGLLSLEEESSLYMHIYEAREKRRDKARRFAAWARGKIDLRRARVA